MMKTGELIDKLHTLREQKRELEAAIKPISAEMESINNYLLEKLQEEGMPKASGKSATVSVGETVVPNVDDWDSFYDYIKKEDALYLLERRVSSTAYRELRNLIDGEIPGVTPFTKITLNLRSI
jgi:hypothetical protein